MYLPAKSHICDYTSFILVDDNRRMNEKGLTPITIYSFLNWNLVKGAVSTAQQNQLLITEKGKKKKGMQNRKQKACFFLLSGDALIHSTA